MVPHVDHRYSTSVDLKLMKALNKKRLDTRNRGLGSVTTSSIHNHHEEIEHIDYTYYNKQYLLHMKDIFSVYYAINCLHHQI